MELNLLEILFYGVVSGLTEFLPVSSQAHQKLLMSILGEDGSLSLLNFFVHLGILVALFVSSGGVLKRALREYNFSKKSRRRRKREPNMQLALDYNFVKIATVPLLIAFFFYSKTLPFGDDPPILALLLAINGLLLYIPTLVSRGNKDSRNMSSLDGFLFGLAGALSVFPGISRVGASTSFALLRGADTRNAYKWSLLFSIPALILLCCMDLYGLLVSGFGSLGYLNIMMCVLSGCAAYFASSLTISFMKTLTANMKFTGFSYYSWGVALYIFILYLY